MHGFLLFLYLNCGGSFEDLSLKGACTLCSPMIGAGKSNNHAGQLGCHQSTYLDNFQP